ncbi:MAG: arsenate reductase ArsC [Planctomycetota bacterium]
MSDAKRLRILFLGTRNSCRGHMAEGWVRSLYGDAFEAASAGTDPTPIVDPRAVKVMAEVGVDITGGLPTPVAERDLPAYDAVVTVCEGAAEHYRDLSGIQLLRARFDDPPTSAESARSDDEALRIYRRIRNEIRLFVESLCESLKQPLAAAE